MAAPQTARDVQLQHLLAIAKERIVTEAHRRIREAGYRGIGANGVVFRFLRPEGTRLSEMVERSVMTKQAFGEHVASLEAAGYLTRTPDPADGRAKLVVPTPLGREAMEVATAIFADIEEEWAAEVGAEDLATLRSVLERIAGQP